MCKNICIVMSTYNGEKYLSTQLDSILQQENVNLIVYIRDDGSSDNTPVILREYAAKYNNISISLEENIGFRKSFLKALRDAPECDYYGFSDQDDYWYPNKLEKTIELLCKKNASLAFGNAIVTNEVLDENGLLYLEKKLAYFPISLTSSNAHGFLFCFEKRIRDLAVRFPVEKFTVPHDFWIITISDLFGKTVNDLDMVVAKHRRLPNSISRKKPFDLFLKRLKAFLFGKGIVEFYSREVLDLYNNELSDEKKKLVYSCAYYKVDMKEKMRLLKNNRIKFKYKIKVLLNRL